MKSLTLTLGSLILIAPVLADIPVGRGDVSLDATAAATYDSNVFGIEDGAGDYYATLTPHAAYVRTAGELEARANFGVAFERYLHLTQLNAANISADTSLLLSPDPSRKLSGTVEVAYVESSDVNTDVNERVDSKTATFTSTGAWITGPRTDLTYTASYSDVTRNVASDQRLLNAEMIADYKDFLDGYNARLTGDFDDAQSSGQNVRGADLDQYSYSLMAGLGRGFYHDVLHAWVNAGYRILERSDAEAGANNAREASPVFSATLDGPFLPEKYFPKIKSSLEVSYESASTPGVDDTGGKVLAGSMHLTWQARPKTVVSFSAVRSQRLSADDLTVVSSALQLNVGQTFYYNLSGNVSAGYNWDTFRGIGRSDRTAIFSGGLKYLIGRTWTATASYQYNKVQSNLGVANYTREITTLSLVHTF